MKLTVLSYNIHKGRAFFSRQRTWDVLHDLVHDVKPDLIFLQEFLEEPEAEVLLEKFADHLWPHHSFGQNATMGDYHYGNAILSKFPFQATHNTNISNHTLEKRGLLYGKIEVKDKPLHLFCSHLDLTYRGRLQQVEKIKKTVESAVKPDEPIIFCGDVNDWHEKLHEELEAALCAKEVFNALGYDLPVTSPSIFPVLPLDRIYFRGLVPTRAEVLTFEHLRTMSDHLPLVAELEII